jgi:hypothetical protein
MKKSFFLGFSFWLFFSSLLGIAVALEATMSSPVVDFHDRKLQVSSKLDLDFDKLLKEALHSGLEIRFFFTVELYRIRSWWWDENVISMPAVNSVKYDNLKKEYLVGTGEEGSHHIVRDYQKMKEAMLQLNTFPLVFPEDWENSPEDKYYLRVMGEMPSFDPLFLFFSSTEFSTPWAESLEFSLSTSSSTIMGNPPEGEKEKRAVP